MKILDYRKSDFAAGLEVIYNRPSYPATIEEKIIELDYINEVCACQGYDENDKPYVKLVVSLTDKEADEEEIREKLMTFCKENIEGYACPRKIFFMPELPRTKMEKIDFVKLSDPVPQPKIV